MHCKREAAKSSAALVTKHRQWPNDVWVEHNAGALASFGAGVSTGTYLPPSEDVPLQNHRDSQRGQPIRPSSRQFSVLSLLR